MLSSACAVAMLPLWLISTAISTAGASAADDVPILQRGWRAFGLVVASGPALPLQP